MWALLGRMGLSQQYTDHTCEHRSIQQLGGDSESERGSHPCAGRASGFCGSGPDYGLLCRRHEPLIMLETSGSDESSWHLYIDVASWHLLTDPKKLLEFISWL